MVDGLLEQFLDQIDGAVDGRSHRLAQAHMDIPIEWDRCGFTPNDSDSLERISGECRGQCEDLRGHQVMPGEARRRDVARRLDDDERPGRPAARHRIDEDHVVVPISEGVGEIQRANSEIGNVDVGPTWATRQPAHDLDPKPVVTQEDVADSSDQRAAHNGSTSSGRMKKR
jgi:hypothetical protein